VPHHKLNTEFAPAERSTRAELRRQAVIFSGMPDFRLLADFVPDPLLVLNSNRQIVFANTSALKIASVSGHADPLGLRPGEALSCQNAESPACGCGTSSFCRYCGAVRSILSSLKGEHAADECSITQEGTGDAFVFLAQAMPYSVGGEPFSIFMLRDLTTEKRRQVLERIFFHDVRNTLTALNGWVSVLGDKLEGAELLSIFRTLSELSQELIDTIRNQEQLVQAENRTLAVEMAGVDSLSLLDEVQSVYAKQAALENKTILISPQAKAVGFRSDASLLRRVLGNMLKNALEAEGQGGQVLMKCDTGSGKVHFQVHNASVMPPEVQSQVFKLSFSTKGKGRGLGTYSMRLLSERYLSGSVSFVSTPENGTVFTASYPLS
jgi:signal transduction histidine kinase